jgi:aryl-alcohol dehydrogenase-like predicted oxidoreductase
MNLFRSEEHIGRWLRGRPPGVTISVKELSRLGHAWYEDRLSPGWRPHTLEENQAILDRLGLTGDFWRLT